MAFLSQSLCTAVEYSKPKMETTTPPKSILLQFKKSIGKRILGERLLSKSQNIQNRITVYF